MKKLLILTILTLIYSLSTSAQDKTTDLKRLFELMRSEKMMDGMMSSMLPGMKQMALEQIKGNDAKEKFEKYMEISMSEIKILSHKMITDDMIQIYDSNFTHVEIKDLIKFYESPTGQKMLEKTPKITADLMNSMMTKYMPEFRQKLHKLLEELR